MKGSIFIVILLGVGIVYFMRSSISNSYYQSGVKKYEQGEYQKALQKFLKAYLFRSSRSVDLSHLLHYRALTYEKLSNYPEAIDDYNDLIKLSTGEEKALYYEKRAAIYNEIGKIRQAITDLTRSINIDSTKHKFRLRSKLNLELGEYDKAAADCVFAGLEPTDKYVRSLNDMFGRMADSAFSIQQYELAINYWELQNKLSLTTKTAEIHSNMFTAYQLLADEFFKKKEYGTALLYYKKTHEIKPTKNARKIVSILIHLAESETITSTKKKACLTAIKHYNDILNFDARKKKFVNARVKPLRCCVLQNDLQLADKYASKLDFALLNRVDAEIGAMIQREGGLKVLIIYFTQIDLLKEIEKKADNTFAIDPYEFERAVNMTNTWRTAHRIYKEVMDGTKELNCSEKIRIQAFEANADMMMNWMINSSNISKALLLARLQ